MRQTSRPILGLIGGLSWHSTSEYYRLINEAVTDKHGKQNNPKIIVDSLNFEEVSNMFKTPSQAIDYITDRCMKLESIGCHAIALASNTVHMAAQNIIDHIQVPFIHIGDAVIKELEQLKLNKALLLGTRFTMSKGFYQSHLEKSGIQVIIPESNHRYDIDRIIYQELVNGQFNESSRKLYLDLIQHYKDRYDIDSALASCTEIPLLLQSYETPVPVIDSTEAHCKMISNWFLSYQKADKCSSHS